MSVALLQDAFDVMSSQDGSDQRLRGSATNEKLEADSRTSMQASVHQVAALGVRADATVASCELNLSAPKGRPCGHTTLTA